MTVATDIDPRSPGLRAKRLRILEHLSQRQLASMAGVSREDVTLLEENLPLRLDARRRLLRELWARKASKVGEPA